MKLIQRLACALAFAAAATTTAYAQEWPARAVTWIVPFAAGGPTDAMARDIAQRVGNQIGQSIVVENVPGAGGTLGAAKAARSKADGYTFLVGHMGYMGAAPSLYKQLAYDPVQNFDGVFRFPDTPLVLLVNAHSPYQNAADLIQAAKDKPDTLNFSNAGVGSTSHLVAALFASKAGIQVTPIAYRGAGPALNDLMGGQVDAMFDQSNTALPQVAGGRIRAIALTSLEAMPAQYPGVQPLADAALPGFEAATWYGLYAPKGTPPAVIERMHAAYLAALEDQAWQAKMAELGIKLLPKEQYAPKAFEAFTAQEVARWAEVAKEANISLD